ncbi:MAG: 50S ribosome-binding GTPase [Chloroflexi bacterium]|nr:50S ribosome-binding GTPase [Chloroflexota bacterium]
MPANLPPQYHEAEQRFRKARLLPEKMAALQEMLAIMPKHKGTDHLKAELRARMAKLTEELEMGSRSGGGRTQPFSLPKEGAGRAALVGLPNSGKSLLLAQATGAQARVAPYPFATKEPVPGMLRFENVRIQLVDTPSINDREVQTRLYGLLRTSDVLVVMADLGADAASQARQVLAQLEEWGFQLLARDEEPDPDSLRPAKRVVLVGSKADLPGAAAQFQRLAAEYGTRFPVMMVSAAQVMGLEELAREVFRTLRVVRVYTKAPGREAERTEPIIMPVGSTVGEAAEKVHKQFRSMRYAVLWGPSGKFGGQRVGREHTLADGDVVELHG